MDQLHLHQSLESELVAADAQAALADALVRSTVQLTSKGLREAVFLMLYLGPEGEALVSQVLRMKFNQTPGALKRIVEAIKALSLSDFMRGVNLNLGNR